MTNLKAVGLLSFPPLGAVLVGAFAWLTPFLVRSILVGLGVGLITYVGIDAGISSLQGYVTSTLTGLPVNMLNIVALTRLDDAATVVMSAISARVALNLTTGAVSRITLGAGS